MSTTAIREQTIMTVFKTKKDEAYTPKGDWDWSNLSDSEIKSKVSKFPEEADRAYVRGEYESAEKVFKEWEERHKECFIR